LQPSSEVFPLAGTLASLAPVSTRLDPGLAEKEQLSGITPPQFYAGLVMVPNDGNLRDGMTGTAKVFVRRRSLAALAWRFIRDQVERRLW